MSDEEIKQAQLEDETCPCEEGVTEEQCEQCQDLPRGYFKARREEERMRRLIDEEACKKVSQ
jgi:hypothetical protein